MKGAEKWCLRQEGGRAFISCSLYLKFGRNSLIGFANLSCDESEYGDAFHFPALAPREHVFPLSVF